VAVQTVLERFGFEGLDIRDLDVRLMRTFRAAVVRTASGKEIVQLVPQPVEIPAWGQ